jgi:hypothetical protein
MTGACDRLLGFERCMVRFLRGLRVGPDNFLGIVVYSTWLS